jgi:hypothetical protein
MKKVIGPLDWSQDEVKGFFVALSRLEAKPGEGGKEVKAPKMEGDKTQVFVAPP